MLDLPYDQRRQGIRAEVSHFRRSIARVQLQLINALTTSIVLDQSKILQRSVLTWKIDVGKGPYSSVCDPDSSYTYSFLSLNTMSSKPLQEQIRLVPLSENAWTTADSPRRMGNPLNIAYGGYAVGVACKAASISKPESYSLYSLTGNYLGPAFSDRPLIARVKVLRQTRTFATCLVEVSQTLDVNGQPGKDEERVGLIAIVDFQTPEKASLMEYSRSPSMQWPKWNDCPTLKETRQRLVDQGKLPQKLADAHAADFSAASDVYEQRLPPNGIFAQNMYGMMKKLPHTQDDLPVVERRTADWFRIKEDLKSKDEHESSLAFTIDGAIAFSPLSFDHLYFDDIAACSSMDFAMRVFRNDLDLNRWHLREISTSVGSEGRNFGEAWVFDEEGKAVATMSQQSIMRPAKKHIKEKL